uniref:Retrotransposon Copia-like N-terminal domain-containing protein n=1 Tax=Nelumbo nucifera TaxID=4432 RepID=A0A822Z7U4_NELNU|nr:TPA_asm: hypothetical protein HUJ06_013389 [Nelumbo nucifera]
MSTSNTSSQTCITQTTLPIPEPVNLCTNVTQLISVKLDRHNYLLWRLHMLSVLDRHQLMCYVDGSLKCPQFITSSIGALQEIRLRTQLTKLGIFKTNFY